jgi:isoquinoline 1-oxidoreductase subunit alpha
MDTTLTINGERKSFEAPSDMPLLCVLRDLLGMTGTKFGCGIALCGACTVHIDGKPVRSCMLPVGAVRDRVVTTIEGIGATPAGAKVQKAWLDLEVVQCGYCQPGQIMSAAALLATTLNPDDSDIDAAMGGKYLSLWHLCAHSRRNQAGCFRASIVRGAHSAFHNASLCQSPGSRIS